MPSRRQHTKTRHGCAPCKARKKRCGLERPICQNCVRLGSECSYPNQAPAAGQPWYIGSDSPSSSSSSTNSPPWLLQGQPAAPSPPVSTFDVDSLALMHHYTALTGFSMTENSSHLYIWQMLIPQLSFSHPFLLHGLLSLAALHRHYRANELKANERAADDLLINQARKHQQSALSMYILHLDDINERNCHAMFIYSMILGGICFAFIRETEMGSLEGSVIDMVTAAFNTLMGATVVAMHAREWLHQGDFEPMLKPLASYEECVARLSPASKAALDDLLNNLSNPGAANDSWIPEDDDAHATYVFAIRALTIAFPHADGSLSSLSDVVSWPVAAGSAYLELLKERDPMALVILAYYGVALHYSDRVWFLQGLGPKLVHAIAEQFEEPWLQCLQWAQQQVQV